MALEITKSNHHFYLKGNLDLNTCQSVQKKVTTFLKNNQEVIINIDKVSEIDSSAVNSIAKLFKKTFNTNKKINIEGYGTKDIYEELMLRDIL